LEAHSDILVLLDHIYQRRLEGGKDATAPADYDEDLVPAAVPEETQEALG
jgi:hypothetical protein